MCIYVYIYIWGRLINVLDGDVDSGGHHVIIAILGI